ncbi:DUF6471 domain-containing protein [Legionella maioricensis]|uniref:DUF6471 domain-containing protein n=1 Tax=Legionella maioricensis TaxID=2896528 RepID=UPI0032B1E1BF
MDVQETHTSILSKMSRASFQFAFFLQCATSIGMTNLSLNDLTPITSDAKSR